jgi:hypothetical protein
METERQRRAAVSWIQYWKASISAGEQSWLGQEQAQETVMALHTQVVAYDKRTDRRGADLSASDSRNSGGAAPVLQPAGTTRAGGMPCGPGSS